LHLLAWQHVINMPENRCDYAVTSFQVAAAGGACCLLLPLLLLLLLLLLLRTCVRCLWCAHLATALAPAGAKHAALLLPAEAPQAGTWGSTGVALCFAGCTAQAMIQQLRLF
jgi:hypothetical protein